MAKHDVARTLRRALSLGGLLGTAGAWAAAALVAATQPHGCLCYAIGYARPDSWAVTMVIYPNGSVLGQYFESYLGQRRGLWIHRSRATPSVQPALRHLVPTYRRTRVSSAVVFHLLLPLLIFGGATMWTCVLPAVRRRLRRRAGRCAQCGYDLTANESGRCPECGTEVDWG